MNATPSPRPLPLNTILSAAGISFHQGTAASLVPGQELVLKHTPDNPYDANAVAVQTESGSMVGHVPAALAARMVASLPNGVWRGKVHEILGKETIGVRFFLGPAVGVSTPPGTGGLRDRDDGYADDTTPVGTDPAVVQPELERGATEPLTGLSLLDEPAAEPAVEQVGALCAYTSGGRLLGTVLDVSATKTMVLTKNGIKAAYPNAIVVVRRATTGGQS